MSKTSEDVYLMGSVAGFVMLVSSESEVGRNKFMLVDMGAAEESGLSKGKVRLSTRYFAFPVLIFACGS